MRRMRIVADSSCDMFELEGADFACAPMKIITAEKEYVDTSELSVDAMVDELYTYKGRSQSSCPNPSDWLDAFGDAEDIFCVTITSALSGSYNSACSAKRLYEGEHPDRRVFVIDTLSAGPEVTLIIRKLEDCIQSKMSYEEICEEITQYQCRTGLLFMLKSLKNFANNGRVSPLVAKLVGIAGICIVGKASNQGTLEPMRKCRGEKLSLETLRDALVSEGFSGGKISMGHCQNEAAALALKAFILETFPQASVEIHPLGGLCGFYVEKGGILVGFEKKKLKEKP